MANKGKLALGAIIGAAAGVVAGILTAPKSGKETRQDIKYKAEELKHRAYEKVDAAKRKAAELEDSVESAMDGAEKKLKHAKTNGKETKK